MENDGRAEESMTEVLELSGALEQNAATKPASNSAEIP